MCVYDSFKKLNLEASSLMLNWCVFLLRRTFLIPFLYLVSQVFYLLCLSPLFPSLFLGGSRKKGGMIHKTYPKDQKKQVKDNLI